MLNSNDTARARDALFAISADLPRDPWVKVGMAAHAAGLSFADWDEWSAQGTTYTAKSCRDTWRSFIDGKGIGAGTLFAVAREHGWTEGAQRQAPARQHTRATEPTRKPAPGMSAAEVWERCEAATNEHGYIAAKGAAGVPLTDLRVIPSGDGLKIAGASVEGYLVVPARSPDGTLQSLQFIPPNGGKKLNLPGASMAGASFIVGWTVPGCRINICEGKHFEGRYERANVYRAVRALLTAHAIHEAAGMVCIAEAAK